jgi:hypothetical protein
VFVRKFTGFK